MRSAIIIAVATSVLLGLGGYTINRYGQARYDAGVADTKAIQAEATRNTTVSNVQDLERRQNESNNMSDADIDRDLHALGIMRNISDR